MNKEDLAKMLTEAEKENSLFSQKDVLDALKFSSSIIGREDKARELVRLLAGYRQGQVVPLISVYGRSGSGKSTVVKFVCANLGDVAFAFVNLRKAKTIFGCANLILGELGQPGLKSAQGINLAVEHIQNSVESSLVQSGKKLFVLVLDEFDVIFYDKRTRPSDFVYKLLVMEEKLREKGLLVCIIGISNNVLAEYELDDRVKSRMGSSEVFFNAYTKKDVLAILNDRAAAAFVEPVDPAVLEYCADQSSLEHGDARRAIDLLRVAGEIAGTKGEKVAKAHVDMAEERLQKDRVKLALSTASYHLKLVCSALARVIYLSGQPWHSTSVIYDQYRRIVAKDTKPLTYRRVSDLLTELENTGLLISHTASKGRHGYGTQYKLAVGPEIVGKTCFPEWWKNLEERKTAHESSIKRRDSLDRLSFNFSGRKSGFTRSMDDLSKSLRRKEEESWRDFVGTD